MKKYKAFISYSHKNEKFATWLHKSLEKYKIPNTLQESYPNLPNKLYPIFKDREELPSSSNLSQNIIEALKESDYLIVICSINSAKSQWVNKEIVDFKRIHGEDKILAIIIDGEPNAKDKKDFNDTLECFPEALKYRIDIKGNLTSERTEPIAADIRKGKDSYRFGKLKLIAGLLNIGFEELYQREEKRQKKNRWIWTFLSIFILTIVSFLALYAFWQKEVAEDKTYKNQQLAYDAIMEQGLIYRDYLNNSIKSKLIFSSLINKSVNNAQENKAKLLYYNIKNSLKLNSITENNTSEYNVIFNKDKNELLTYDKKGLVKLKNLDTNQEQIIIKHTQSVNGVIFNKDKNEVLSWSDDGTLKLWNRITNKVQTITKYDKPIEKASFSQDEQKVLSWESSLFFHKGITKIKLWNRSNNQSKTIIENEGWTRNAIFNHNGTQILSFTERGIVKLWKESNNKVKTIFTSRTESYGIPIVKIQFLKKDKVLIATEKGISFLKIDSKDFFIVNKSFNDQYNLTLWNEEKNSTKFILEDDSKIKNIKFISYEDKIISWSEHSIKQYNVEKEEETLILKNNSKIISVKLNKDNQKIICCYSNGLIDFIDMESNDISSIYHGLNIKSAEFINNETQILTWGSDGAIKIWDIINNKHITITHKSILSGMKINPEETEILSWDYNHFQIFNIKDKRKIFDSYFLAPFEGENYDIPIKGMNFNKNNIFAWGGDMDQLIDINESSTSYLQIGLIRLWDRDTKKRFVRNYYIPVNNVQLSKSQKKLLINAGDSISEGAITLFNVKKEQEKFVSKNNEKLISTDDYLIKESRFINNEKHALSIGYDGKLKIWDIKTKKELYQAELNSTINGVVKYKSKYLTYLSNGEVFLLNKTLKTKSLISKYQASVGGALFNKNGNKILSYSHDGNVKLWDKKIQKDVIISVFETSVNGAIFNKDENLILSWSGNQTYNSHKMGYKDLGVIKLYSIENSKSILTLKHNTSILGATFNEDETLILSWSSDGILKLWDIKNGKELITLKPNTFSNNGSKVGAKFIHNNTKIIYWANSKIHIYNLFGKKQLHNRYYPLKTQVETGTYLSSSGELKTLSAQEWLEKKKLYESKLKE